MIHKLIITLFLLSLYEGPDKPNVLSSPLDMPLILSANFGELRPGHFHSGVDFKTGGVTGKKVYSASDGYIYRIVVSPTGFGKALYIRHSNGLSTVYGHLSRFTSDIEDYVKKAQYQRQSFSVNIFPGSDMFSISDGEIIGYSGNSGSSMGPHLHFEVRKTKGEKPVNPIQYYDIEDDIRPVISSVAVYPASPTSKVNGKNEKLILKAEKGREHYTAGQGSSVRVSGPVGFGINTHDYVNNSWNRCGVRIINLKVDDRLVYSHTIDEFSFAETRYINSHIDYEEKMRSSSNIQKTFREPNNMISTYNHLINNGIIETIDGKTHKVEISVSDFNNNYSSISFDIEAEKAALAHTEETEGYLMPYGQTNEFIRDDIKIKFPANCFYDSIYFRYKKVTDSRIEGLFSDLHQVHNKYIPVHSSYALAVKVTDDLPVKLRSKLCLVYIR
ncbi:MAG: M23 family metallopeptidase [Bacteroidales bacterium]|nr:M23 family metallopeptidase [Bacteroidales bacterium]